GISGAGAHLRRSEWSDCFSLGDVHFRWGLRLRKGDVEDRAAGGAIFGRNCSAVAFDDGAADGQAEADSAAILAAVGAEEFFEDARFSAFGKAGAVVGDGEGDVAVDGRAADFDGGGGRGVLDGIVEEIHQDLFESDAIDVNKGEILG